MERTTPDELCAAVRALLDSDELGSQVQPRMFARDCPQCGRALTYLGQRADVFVYVCHVCRCPWVAQPMGLARARGLPAGIAPAAPPEPGPPPEASADAAPLDTPRRRGKTMR